MNSTFSLDQNGVGSEPRYNILSEQHELLYCMLTRSDAKRIIGERQASPEKYPLWQGALIVKLVTPSQAEVEYSGGVRRRSWPDVLPKIPAGKQRQPIYYLSGNLGLGDDNVHIGVECGSWRGWISLEEALFNIDHFTDEGRQRILQCLPYQFDMEVRADTNSKTANQSWAVSYAGTLLPFRTKSEAKRFIRENHKNVADRRGGCFKATIVRIAGQKEATH